MSKILKTRINVLDTTRKINEEFLFSLRRRNIPSKFSYWGKEETKHWLNVCKDPEYINWRLEMDLLDENLPEIVESIGPKVNNLISLGIGNGEKDKKVLESFVHSRRIMKYFTIDISLPMVNAGFKVLNKISIEKTAYIGDFERVEELTHKINKKTNGDNLICLLGNTLGNLPQVATLNLIRRSMDKNDYFLFAVQVLESGKIMDMGEILSAYNTQSWRDLAFGTIARSGIKKTDGFIEVEFGRDRLYPQLNIVEYFFTFTKDKSIKYLGREIDFKAGERILTYYSYKYDEKNIDFLLDVNGFKAVKTFFSTGGKYMLLLAKLK